MALEVLSIRSCLSVTTAHKSRGCLQKIGQNLGVGKRDSGRDVNSLNRIEKMALVHRVNTSCVQRSTAITSRQLNELSSIATQQHRETILIPFSLCPSGWFSCV
jgi:hypothetical protein